MERRGSNPLGKGVKRVIEKVEFKGDYRVIGLVSKTGRDNIVGYAVMDVSTYAVRLFTKIQMMHLLKTSKFENVKYVDGGILNLECSMSRLPIYDTQMQLIANAGVTILGRVYKDEKPVGFRVMDAFFKVIDLSDADLITLVQRDATKSLINGKVISNNGKAPYISAIFGNFKKVEQVTEIDTSVIESAKLFKKKQHAIFLDRALLRFYTQLLKKGGIKSLSSKIDKRRAKVVMKEFILPNYPSVRYNSEASPENVIEASLLLYLLDNNSYTFLDGSTTSHMFVNPLNKIVYLNSRRGVIKQVKHCPIKSIDSILELDKSGDLKKFFVGRNSILNGDDFRLKRENITIANRQLLAIARSFQNSRYQQIVKERKRNNRAKGFNPMDIEFTDLSGLNTMGYTTEKGDVGVKVLSEIYGIIPMRYIFSGMQMNPEQEAFFLENIISFGDIEITKRIMAYLTYGNRYKPQAEGLLLILAMHNPVIAKKVNEMCKNFSMIDIDTYSKEEFFLTEEDRLFYESGTKFNKGVYLKRSQSWTDANMGVIPKATYEAINLIVESSTVFPTKFAYAKQLR